MGSGARSHVDASSRASGGNVTAQTAGLASGVRVRVAGGPTPAQLAALLLALDQAIAVDAAAATAAGAAHAWARAARLEALGHRPLAAPADLVDPGSPLTRP